jgi:hypothetical protein
VVFVAEDDPVFGLCERLHLARRGHPPGIATVPRVDGTTPDGRRARGWYFARGFVEEARAAVGRGRGEGERGS